MIIYYFKGADFIKATFFKSRFSINPPKARIKLLYDMYSSIIFEETVTCPLFRPAIYTMITPSIITN